MDGLSTRISGGLVDEVIGTVSNVQRAPTPATPAADSQAPLAPITATESSVTSEQAPASLSPARVDPMSATSFAVPAVKQEPAPVARPEQSTPSNAEPPAATAARDDDRPPPRVPGFAGRRMLAGESYE